MWFNLINGRNDAAAFLPLAIKGGSCSSNSNKYVNTNSSNEDIAKVTFSKANDGIEMNNHTA